jgi:glucokinase
MTCQTSAFHSAADLLVTFLKQAGYAVDRVFLGIAGPVIQGEASMTNLPWVIREDQLREALKVKSVSVLNDLHAMACFLPVLKASELYTLRTGQPEPRGALALIAPGTGLGEAFLVWDGKGYRAYPSEGGHADFTPISDLGIELFKKLRDRFGHVGLERICSVSGILEIYRFLREYHSLEEPEWLIRQFDGAENPVPVIIEAALHQDVPCDLCRQTMEIFSSALAVEAANLALKVLATGGVYFGGGIVNRILPFLQSDHFSKSFQRKGRLSELVSKIPIHVVVEPKAGLYGAAYFGLAMRD